LDTRINHFDAFKDVYGFVAGDDVLRFTAMLMGEVVDQFGTPKDFIGHAGGDNFIIILDEQVASAVHQNLKSRFAEEVLTHYNFMDREQGFLVAADDRGREVQSPLMEMAIGMVSPAQYQFADIREITELAAEARRNES
ncbi:MAG TPA: diguanylate cyclase, partial [Candidatus Obscuribacterales bacterium]